MRSAPRVSAPCVCRRSCWSASESAYAGGGEEGSRCDEAPAASRIFAITCPTLRRASARQTRRLQPSVLPARYYTIQDGVRVEHSHNQVHTTFVGYIVYTNGARNGRLSEVHIACIVTANKQTDKQTRH